jgi:hypothetical protein
MKLHDIVNLPAQFGKVEGVFDQYSLVYASTREGESKAIVLINFDPNLQLPGLEYWKGPPEIAGRTSEATPLGKSTARRPSRKRKREVDSPLRTAEDSVVFSSQLELEALLEYPRGSLFAAWPQARRRQRLKEDGPASECPWMSVEPSMYLSIGRGYNFGF